MYVISRSQGINRHFSTLKHHALNKRASVTNKLPLRRVEKGNEIVVIT